MYHFLLEANEAGTTLNPDFMARLGEATAVLAQGMLTVFAVLCIIWLCLAILRVFVHDIPERRRKKAAARAAEAEASPADVSAPMPLEDAALVAVIAAAVAAYRADDEGGFRVVAFHRVKK